MIDRFFDCLNVRSLDEGVRKRKPDWNPYYDSGDVRLKVIISFCVSITCIPIVAWAWLFELLQGMEELCRCITGYN